jgi:hypothetical protein
VSPDVLAPFTADLNATVIVPGASPLELDPAASAQLVTYLRSQCSQPVELTREQLDEHFGFQRDADTIVGHQGSNDVWVRFIPLHADSAVAAAPVFYLQKNQLAAFVAAGRAQVFKATARKEDVYEQAESISHHQQQN